MKREKLTAAQIQEIVQQQVDRLHDVIEDKAEVRVPLPQRLIVEGSSCNWSMEYFGNAVGYEKQIKKVLRWAQSQFQLADEY